MRVVGGERSEIENRMPLLDCHISEKCFRAFVVSILRGNEEIEDIEYDPYTTTLQPSNSGRFLELTHLPISINPRRYSAAG